MPKRISLLSARGAFTRRLIFGLVLKPLRLFCDHCDGYCPSDLPWRCRHCGHHNTRTRFYSFLNKCEHCKRSPKAFTCPRCSKANFLDSHGETTNAALIDGAVVEELPTSNPDPADEFERRKNDIERQIELTILEARLARIKAQVAAPHQKSTREKLVESIEERNAKVLEMHILKKEMKAKNDIRFANDPELRDLANEALDTWAEEQL